MRIFSSPNQRLRKEKISILVIHYTEIDWLSTQKKFLDPQSEVSAHLVIDQDGTVYRFVEDDCVAYHAGQSWWYGIEGVNEHSIGIELVHPGFEVIDEKIIWLPYDDRQIKKLIEICQTYIQKYNILPQNIVGHSDVAPWRYDANGLIHKAKIDPGPLFPWKYLYENGIGCWRDVAHPTPEELKALGYHVTNHPLTFECALCAFHAHFDKQYSVTL